MPKNKIPDLQASAMPPVKDYLTAVQRDGSELCADDVYKQTVEWLKSKGCENAISAQVVEQYAMSVARWVHLEEMITKYGYIAKHPTTGAPMQSPYVTMAQSYLKQASAIRAEILMLVKDARPAITATMREVVYGG
ncbi:MAG: P27 family phage terminase small subunit [Oscillospiraceae bacterium]|nr:P27 family phage terminase small subunit [Oscillospiraceae bacterium]